MEVAVKNKADIIDYVKQKSIYNEKRMIDNLAEIFSWNALNAADLKVLKRKLFNDYRECRSDKYIKNYAGFNKLELVYEITTYDLLRTEQTYISIHKNNPSNIKRVKIMYICMRMFVELSGNDVYGEYEMLNDNINSRINTLYALESILWNKYIRYRFEVDAIDECEVFKFILNLIRYCRDYDTTDDKYQVKANITYLFGI